MEEHEYLEIRIKDQIDWYERKSQWYKKLFLRFKITETILALFIPLFAGYITTEMIELKIVLGLIGVMLAAIANIVTLYKIQENWIEYRKVAETLKHEKFMYLAKAGPYKDNGGFAIFVERIESYISKENGNWVSYIKFKKNEKPDE